MVPGLRAGYYLCSSGMSAEAACDGCSRGGGVHTLGPCGRIADTNSTFALETTAAATSDPQRYGVLVAKLALALNGPDAANCSHKARTVAIAKWRGPVRVSSFVDVIHSQRARRDDQSRTPSAGDSGCPTGQRMRHPRSLPPQ